MEFDTISPSGEAVWLDEYTVVARMVCRISYSIPQRIDLFADRGYMDVNRPMSARTA